MKNVSFISNYSSCPHKNTACLWLRRSLIAFWFNVCTPLGKPPSLTEPTPASPYPPRLISSYGDHNSKRGHHSRSQGRKATERGTGGMQKGGVSFFTNAKSTEYKTITHSGKVTELSKQITGMWKYPNEILGAVEAWLLFRESRDSSHCFQQSFKCRYLLLL